MRTSIVSARWPSLSFSHDGGGGVIQPPVVAGGFYPNKPANFVNSTEINFSQTPVQSPPANDQVDNAIPGASGWNMIFFQQNWSKISDATAIQSPNDVWQGRIPAGSWYESQTIPGSGPFTVACNFPSNFGADVNLYNLTLDTFMTKVGGAPASGQYSVNGSGTYTFNSANAGQSVLIAYTFANTTGLSGSTATGTPFGHGIGNVFNYTISGGTTRLYISLVCKFIFPDSSYWHSISNKFLNIEANNSLILMQLKEGGNWRHAEELGTPGFFIDPANHAGQLDNRVVPINQWTHLEIVIDLSGTYKVWQDGVLTTSASGLTYASTLMTGAGINSHRGGGGETLAADLYYLYDHFYLAWP